MKMGMKLGLVAGLLAAGAANAQLLYTNGFVNAGAGGRQIFHYDVGTGVTTQWAVFNDSRFGWISGMEIVGRYLYVTDGNDFAKIDVVTKVSTYVGLSTASLQGGLAWDGATLYGTTNGNSLYTVDINTGASTLLGTVTGVTTATLSGLAFNRNDGMIYSSSDGTPDALIKIDPATRVASVVANFPLGDTDLDALAYDGADRYYLVNDSNNTGPNTLNGIYVYNAATNTYEAGIQTVFTGSAAGGYSAAAYIPAPGAASLLALAGLAAARRRRA